MRPLSLGEILDVAFKICFAHWQTLLKSVLIVVVPMQILTTILTADYTIDSLDMDAAQTPEESLDQLNQYLGGVAASSALQVIATTLATAACVRAIALAYLGASTDWRSSVSHALRRLPALLLVVLLWGLAIMVGMLLFIAPGVWLFVAWGFALPALLVEGKRGTKALGRSYGLVRGRWWRTFGVLVLGYLIAMLISIMVQAVFFIGIFVGADNHTLVLILSALGGAAGLAVTTPFLAALLTVLYFDLRVRKEAFDLELLAQDIGGSVGAAPPAAPHAGPPPSPLQPGQPVAGEQWPAPQPRAQPFPDDKAGSLWTQSRPPPPPPPPGWDPPSDGRAVDSEDDRSDEPPRLPGVPSG